MLTDYYYMVTQDDHLFLLDSRYTWKSDFTGIYLFPLYLCHHYCSQYSAKTSAQTFSKASCRLLSSIVVTNFASGLQQVQFLPF